MILIGYPNTGNSCYMDTILFCLFSLPNDFIDKYFFRSRKTYVPCKNQKVIVELKKELKQMRSNLITPKRTMGNFTCNKLKEIIGQCRAQCPILQMYPNFSDSNQHSALEFLNFLLTIWGMNGRRSLGAVMRFSKRYGVSGKNKKHVRWYNWFMKIDKTASLVYYVPYDTFKKFKNVDKYFNIQTKTFGLENTKFKTCFVDTSEEIIKLSSFPDFFVIYVDRVNPLDGQMDHSRRNINLMITDEHGKKLHLNAVIMHMGKDSTSGHFVCIKRHPKGYWLYYDDLSPEITLFKTYKQVKEWNRGMTQTHCVLLFYSL